MDIAQEILAIYRLARDGKITAREALEKAYQLRVSKEGESHEHQ